MATTLPPHDPTGSHTRANHNHALQRWKRRFIGSPKRSYYKSKSRALYGALYNTQGVSVGATCRQVGADGNGDMSLWSNMPREMANRLLLKQRLSHNEAMPHQSKQYAGSTESLSPATMVSPNHSESSIEDSQGLLTPESIEHQSNDETVIMVPQHESEHAASHHHDDHQHFQKHEHSKEDGSMEHVTSEYNLSSSQPNSVYSHAEEEEKVSRLNAEQQTKNSGIAESTGSVTPSNEELQLKYVYCLVQVTVTLIESIWGLGVHDAMTEENISSRTKVLPLFLFVQEILRRSRVSCSVLKLALFYLHSARHGILSMTQGCDSHGHINGNANAGVQAHLNQQRDNNDILGLRDAKDRSTQPIRCGRRMFLASLILASKFVQDRNYSNRAWAKIAGLTIAEVNANELTLLQLLDHRLYVTTDVFTRWSERLVKVGAHVQRRSMMNE